MLFYLVLLSKLSQLIYSLNFCENTISAKFRIVGGIDVLQKDDLTWMTKLISYEEGATEGIMCGATVIDDYWVLTAAHCARQLRTKSYIIATKESGRELTIKVVDAFIHPGYSNYTAKNDIALLKVSSNLKSKGILPVCLSENDENLLKNYNTGIVTGFGVSLEKSGNTVLLSNSNSLQQTSVPIIPSSKCQSTWDVLSFRSVEISSNQLCAGSYMHGTAPGDSGGPLLIETSDKKLIQVGITSFGADGLDGLIDQGKYPGVYTRVSRYIPWIEKIIKNSSSSLLSSHLFFTCFLIFVLNYK